MKFADQFIGSIITERDKNLHCREFNKYISTKLRCKQKLLPEWGGCELLPDSRSASLSCLILPSALDCKVRHLLKQKLSAYTFETGITKFA